MPKTNLQQHIFIDALPGKVWKVLTAPDYIDQYLIDGSLHCQWSEGSPITLVTSAQEKIETVHKGSVLKVIPEVLLKYSLQDENSTGFVTITYQLMPADAGIDLNFQCEGFTDADDFYFFRIQQTRLLLQKVKWLSEYA